MKKVPLFYHFLRDIYLYKPGKQKNRYKGDFNVFAAMIKVDKR